MSWTGFGLMIKQRWEVTRLHLLNFPLGTFCVCENTCWIRRIQFITGTHFFRHVLTLIPHPHWFKIKSITKCGINITNTIDSAVEVLEWINNFILHLTCCMITFTLLEIQLIHVNKVGRGGCYLDPVWCWECGTGSCPVLALCGILTVSYHVLRLIRFMSWITLSEIWVKNDRNMYEVFTNIFILPYLGTSNW